MTEIPQTVVKCGGCGEDLNLLTPFLEIQVKAKRSVLTVETPPFEEGMEEVPQPTVFLGSQSGEGRILQVHDFNCLRQYAEKRKNKTAKIIPHHEDEIYVPEDNRSPEELVKDGELPKEYLKFHEAAAEFVPGSVSNA